MKGRDGSWASSDPRRICPDARGYRIAMRTASRPNEQVTNVYAYAYYCSMSPAMRTEAVVPVRLSQEVLDRADALIEKVESLPEFAVTRVTRSAVLRLAILRGLELLEEETKATKADTGRPTRRK